MHIDIEINSSDIGEHYKDMWTRGDRKVNRKSFFVNVVLWAVITFVFITTFEMPEVPTIVLLILALFTPTVTGLAFGKELRKELINDANNPALEVCRTLVNPQV